MKSDFSELEYLLRELSDISDIFRSDLTINMEEILDNMKNRIDQGLDMNGNIISTFSARQIGRYSSVHGQARIDAGKQVGKIDFQFTGDLFDSIKSDIVDIDTVVGGIEDATNQAKADQNEDYFDVTIFTPSDEEINEVIDTYINKRFE